MATRTTPRVQITELLRANLVADGLDPVDFCEYFAEWKSLGSAGIYTDPYFGKDGYYDRPKRNNKRVLCHVHMKPEADAAKIATWEWQLSKLKEKQSDTALIYAHDPRHGFLLIYLVREPNGHTVSQMKTDATVKLMNDFCDIAEAFMFDGSILV